MNSSSEKPVICFLQGPSGFFFWRLSRELEKRGVRTLRINLCAGDRLNWPGPSIQYRGSLDNWREFVEKFLAESAVTTLVLLGEQRTYHRVAIEAAHKLGINVVVTELGYLRPDWLTLELDGMSGNSRFPRNPQEIRKLANGLKDPDFGQKYRNNFALEAFSDVSFHMANLLCWFLYPHYKTHLLKSPLIGNFGIGLHMLLSRIRKRNSSARVQSLLSSGRPYFVFPLQIENDFQIRAYSHYHSVADAITEVMTSFARHAPQQSILVIKEHPREIAWLGWGHYCRNLAKVLGISERVIHLDGGPLDTLISSSLGVITINSTTGLQALFLGRPLQVLGQAIFKIEGLVHSGSLDDFWEKGIPPDKELRDDFTRLLDATVQVRGGFYSSKGSKAASREMAERLIAGRINHI